MKRIIFLAAIVTGLAFFTQAQDTLNLEGYRNIENKVVRIRSFSPFPDRQHLFVNGKDTVMIHLRVHNWNDLVYPLWDCCMREGNFYNLILVPVPFSMMGKNNQNPDHEPVNFYTLLCDSTNAFSGFRILDRKEKPKLHRRDIFVSGGFDYEIVDIEGKLYQILKIDPCCHRPSTGGFDYYLNCECE